MRRLLILSVFLLAALRLYNGLFVPATAGFDARGHGENVLLLIDEAKVPLPGEGPQSYHPPGYAWSVKIMSAFLQPQNDEQKLRVGNLTSALGSLLALVCTFFLARRIVAGWEWHAVLLAALLPAEVLTASTIYNGPVAYGLLSLLLLLVHRATDDPEPRLAQEIGFGFLAGAATLVRYDCIISLGLLGALWLFRVYRGVSVRDASAALLLSFTCFLFVVHWYWFRNLAEFGRCLVFGLDKDVLPYSHLIIDATAYPGYRSLSFFLTLDPIIWVDPGYGSAATSFWSMNYASLWWDHNELFLPEPNLAAARILLTLGLFPTAMWILGTWRIARHHLREGWLILLQQLMTWSVCLSLVLSHPTLPQVKANFFYTSFGASAICAAAGLRVVSQRWPQVQRPLEGILVATGLVVIWAFAWR